jgi:N-formylmaleamate deformylase
MTAPDPTAIGAQPSAPGAASTVDAVYERAGFGRPVRRGARPAIVVVDLSRGFTEPQFATGSDLSGQVAATAELIAAGRPHGVPTIFTTIAYEANLHDGGAWLEKASGLGILQLGSELVEIDPRLPREPQDSVVVKKGASAFFGTNLHALLAAQRVDTVILCGATTSGCVRASAVDAVQYGYPTLVPREAVGDRAAPPHEANLFDIQAKYADVIPLAEALAYLRALA